LVDTLVWLHTKDRNKRLI